MQVRRLTQRCPVADDSLMQHAPRYAALGALAIHHYPSEAKTIAPGGNGPRTERFGPKHLVLFCLLRLLVRREAGRLVVIGRIELGAITAPGRVLQDAIDFAQPARREP
jgi:hypothetical protein